MLRRRRPGVAQMLMFRDALSDRTAPPASPTCSPATASTRHGSISATRSPPSRDPMSVYNDIDISLDSFPWSGHTTACESMWMGVPMVTLRGTTHAGRMAASTIIHAGKPQWVAEDHDQFVAIAARAWPRPISTALAAARGRRCARVTCAPRPVTALRRGHVHARVRSACSRRASDVERASVPTPASLHRQRSSDAESTSATGPITRLRPSRPSGATLPSSHCTSGNRRNHFICRRANWRVPILIRSAASSSGISREMLDQFPVARRLGSRVRELAVTPEQARTSSTHPAAIIAFTRALIRRFRASLSQLSPTHAAACRRPASRPFRLERRDGLAGQLEHLQGTHEPLGVVGVDAGGGGRVDLAEPAVQFVAGQARSRSRTASSAPGPPNRPSNSAL